MAKKINKSIGLLVTLVASFFLYSCSTNDGKPSKLSYEILEVGNEYSIVLLKEEATNDQLNIVADSLFNSKHDGNRTYKTMFYYRRDYKGHVCFAQKIWINDTGASFLPGKLEVTGVKSIDP